MMSRDDLVRDGRFEEAVKSVIGPDGVRAGRNNLSGGVDEQMLAQARQQVSIPLWTPASSPKR